MASWELDVQCAHWHVAAPEKPVFGFDRRKQIGEIADRFGAAQQQDTPWFQAVVKERQQFLLQGGAEIDE